MTPRLNITVGRQLGSGGGQIAKRLAEIFNCQLYDRELLNLAARESGFSADLFEHSDEQKNFLDSLGATLFSSRAAAFGSRLSNNLNSEEALFQFQSDAIRKAASQNDCVFVGRCADYILRDEPRCVNIFITAPLEQRLKRVMERHQCDEQKALKILNGKEHRRANYYNFYTGKRWGAAESYDLCIDSSILGIEGTAAFIAEFIKQK